MFRPDLLAKQPFLLVQQFFLCVFSPIPEGSRWRGETIGDRCVPTKVSSLLHLSRGGVSALGARRSPRHICRTSSYTGSEAPDRL